MRVHDDRLPTHWPGRTGRRGDRRAPTCTSGRTGSVPRRRPASRLLAHEATPRGELLGSRRGTGGSLSRRQRPPRSRPRAGPGTPGGLRRPRRDRAHDPGSAPQCRTAVRRWRHRSGAVTAAGPPGRRATAGTGGDARPGAPMRRGRSGRRGRRQRRRSTSRRCAADLMDDLMQRSAHRLRARRLTWLRWHRSHGSVPGRPRGPVERRTGQGPADRHLHRRGHPVMYNPEELKLEQGNNFAEVGIPGLNAPPVQYVRGQDPGPHRWSCSSTPTRPARTCARTPRRIVALLDKRSADAGAAGAALLHRPVRSSAACSSTPAQRFTMFARDGTPVRSTMSVRLQEYVDVDDRDPAGALLRLTHRFGGRRTAVAGQIA